MEGHFSTGQSPQWAVVPMEEEEEYTSSLYRMIQEERPIFWKVIVLVIVRKKFI